MSWLARIVRLVRIALLVIGCIFLLIAGGTGLSTHSSIARSIRVKATITALEPHTDPEDNSVTYRPRFQYTAPDGSSHSSVSSTGSNPAGFQIGQQVDIFFDPASPDSPRIDTPVQLWLLPAIFAFIGAILVIVGYFLKFANRFIPAAPPPIGPK